MARLRCGENLTLGVEKERWKSTSRLVNIVAGILWVRPKQVKER